MHDVATVVTTSRFELWTCLR